MKRITVNKIFYDRRAGKPRWLCTVQGGQGVNNCTISGKGVGCSRGLAYARAMRQFRKNAK